MPHGFGTFTFSLFLRNHVCAQFDTYVAAHGDEQEGVFRCGIVPFTAVGMRTSITTARSATIHHRRALVQVGRLAGALQPLP